MIVKVKVQAPAIVGADEVNQRSLDAFRVYFRQVKDPGGCGAAALGWFEFSAHESERGRLRAVVTDALARADAASWAVGPEVLSDRVGE